MSHQHSMPLSSENRRRGTRLFFQSSFYNGFAFAFLADSIVQLIAIHFKASNLELGYLASVIHISGFIIPVVPFLFGGRKIVNVYFLFWLLRGLLSLGYGGVIFLEGQPAVLLILVCYTLFALTRNIGFAMDTPLKHILFPERKRGKRISRYIFWFQSSRLIGRLASYILMELQFFKSIIGLVFIQYTGVIFNSITAILIKRVPVEDRIEKSNPRKIVQMIGRLFRKKDHLLILGLYLTTVVAFIFISLMIAFQRKVLGYNDAQVLLVQFFASVGYIVSAATAPLFIERVKSIPMLLMFFSSQLILLLFCAFAPSGIDIVVISILMVLLFSNHSFLFILCNKKLLGIFPTDSKIGFSSIVNFSTAIVALLFGTTGGWLADFSEYNHIGFYHIYTFSFILGAVVCSIGIFIAITLSFIQKQKDQRQKIHA